MVALAGGVPLRAAPGTGTPKFSHGGFLQKLTWIPAIDSGTRGGSEAGSAEVEDMDFSSGEVTREMLSKTKLPTNSSAAFGE
ncbi:MULTISPECIES: hypothetical protein [Cupriavidus]|uniref:hypothetical protein n=1 Tax=Cupriavidus sp. DF5525 TaxID=3160989 RepID=UPI0032DED8BB